MSRDMVTRLERLVEQAIEHVESIEQDPPDRWAVVGGAVRDAILGEEANDLDFVVLGETPDSMRERGFELIEASSFPVFHDGEREEWALARTETSTGHGYDGFDVETEGVELEEDLSRRDLTINAMALEVDDDTSFGWHLVDPHDGVEDLEDGVLRHVSESFAEDPLRVLRTARYAGRYDFQVADETEALVRSLVPELNLMSRDRIGEEFRRGLLEAESVRTYVETLADCGALAVLWPELYRAQLVPAGPEQYHAEGDTFEHTLMVLEEIEEICDVQDIEGQDRLRRYLMALAHDLGKVAVANRKGGIHSDDPPTRFGGHDDVGAEIASRMARRLGLGGELRSVMEDACQFHMRFHDVPDMGTGELVEFLGDMPGSGVNHGRRLGGASLFRATVWELLDLAQADHQGRLHEADGEMDLVRPRFDRQPFVSAIEAVEQATVEVSGYDALRWGACSEHHDLGEDDLARQMSECRDCRDPGEWVGDQVAKMQRQAVRRHR